MFVTVGILGYKKQKTGIGEQSCFTAALRPVAPVVQLVTLKPSDTLGCEFGSRYLEVFLTKKNKNKKCGEPVCHYVFAFDTRPVNRSIRVSSSSDTQTVRKALRLPASHFPVHPSIASSFYFQVTTVVVFSKVYVEGIYLAGRRLRPSSEPLN